MSTDLTIQLHDICEALGVGDRDARYVLERGFVPKGVYVKPASGTHRQFSGGQAYWLGLVLKLKATGIKTPLAATLFVNVLFGLNKPKWLTTLLQILKVAKEVQ